MTDGLLPGICFESCREPTNDEINELKLAIKTLELPLSRFDLVIKEEADDFSVEETIGRLIVLAEMLGIRAQGWMQ